MNLICRRRLRQSNTRLRSIFCDSNRRVEHASHVNSSSFTIQIKEYPERYHLAGLSSEQHQQHQQHRQQEEQSRHHRPLMQRQLLLPTVPAGITATITTTAARPRPRYNRGTSSALSHTNWSEATTRTAQGSMNMRQDTPIAQYDRRSLDSRERTNDEVLDTKCGSLERQDCSFVENRQPQHRSCTHQLTPRTFKNPSFPPSAMMPFTTSAMVSTSLVSVPYSDI